MSESSILFNHKFYKQYDTVALGSSLGPTFANISHSYHERNWFQSCPSEFRPDICRRQVSDTFLHFLSKHHLENFRNYSNFHNKNLRFTSETESENSILFPNIKISKFAIRNNKVATSVYRKLTFSGVLTNFGNFIPKSYKPNLLITLLEALKLCYT